VEIIVPDWIWYVSLFALGCCVGSFLNVVIYRLPKDKSLVKPPSACPACGKHIRFYDNIPLISWILLGAKCRYCKAHISVRYFLVEFLTGLVFAGLFHLYFRIGIRAGLGSFFIGGGWLVYLLHITLLSALIAAAAIDLELWVIPLCICWFVTAVGLVGSALGVFVIAPEKIWAYKFLPSASVNTGALAAGAFVGLVISVILLATGLVKRSYETQDGQGEIHPSQGDADTAGKSEPENPEPADTNADKKSRSEATEPHWNHRLEVCREILFLAPVVMFALLFFIIVRHFAPVGRWWLNFSQGPVVAGFLGSLWGYFVGGGIVWATRIAGTIGFKKEAMGLGDVHLMAGAGAVLGPVMAVVAFFIAPFYGLSWAAVQMFFKKSRQIPYGPFLSAGLLTVMILHDRILNYLSVFFYH